MWIKFVGSRVSHLYVVDGEKLGNGTRTRAIWVTRVIMVGITRLQNQFPSVRGPDLRHLLRSKYELAAVGQRQGVVTSGVVHDHHQLCVGVRRRRIVLHRRDRYAALAHSLNDLRRENALRRGYDDVRGDRRFLPGLSDLRLRRLGSVG